MFIPNENAAAEATAIKRECARIESMALALVPEDIRSACQINVSEFQCGDPTCAPIDTSIVVVFNRSVLRRRYTKIYTLMSRF
jgi:hypothetical protein